MRVIYDTGTLPDSNTSISTGFFLLLVLFSFMTGAGGSGGFVASLNVTAKSFPDSLVCTKFFFGFGCAVQLCSDRFSVVPLSDLSYLDSGSLLSSFPS